MRGYLGSRTTRERNARGDGITVFDLDPVTGAFEPVQVVGDLVNPSYLALAADGSRLYCVHGDGSEATAFRVDQPTGRLTRLNRKPTAGRNPVHLALDPTQRFLVVSNHLGSNLAVLSIGDDGELGSVVAVEALSGPLGPHRLEQQQSKPHFNLFDPSGRWVIVPDKGLDRIFSYRFEGGRLMPAGVPFATAREGSGPRNAVFHPALPLVYVINELASTVLICNFEPVTGTLTPRHLVSTLSPAFTGDNRAAGIAIDRRGRCLYLSNRGHDSVTALTLDPATGLPGDAITVATRGQTPRFITLTPDDQWLVALNEDSDSVVAFDLDGAGRPIEGREVARCGSPVCLVFAPIGAPRVPAPTPAAEERR